MRVVLSKSRLVCVFFVVLMLVFSVVLVPVAFATGASYYVGKSDSSGSVGDGSKAKPFRGLAQAMAKINDGDTLVLMEDILHAEETPGGGFTFAKKVTIEGGNHTLTFRGTDVFFDADVSFKSVGLSVVANGTEQTNLWANGHNLSFTDVNTKLTGVSQDSWRPILYTGAKTGYTSGASTITITGGDSQQRFKQIVIGDATPGSTMDASVVIDSQFAQVDEGIFSTTSGKVSVTSKSSNVKKFVGNAANPNESITFDAVKLYSVDISGIDNVSLRGASEVTPVSISSSFNSILVEDGSQLLLNSPNVHEVNVSYLAGDARVVLGAHNTLNVNVLDGVLTIEARVWNDADREALLAREFLTTNLVSGSPTVVVKQSGTETVVKHTDDGKWIGAEEETGETPDVPAQQEKIEFTSPTTPVVLDPSQEIDAAFVYRLLSAPDGVSVGAEGSKPNTVSVNGTYRGYLYLDSSKLPAPNQYGDFTIGVIFVDDVLNTKQNLVVRLVRPKPTQPETTISVSSWIDSSEADAKNCDDVTVKQTRTRTTTTYVWDEKNGVWEARSTDSVETQTRAMDDSELRACAVKPDDEVDTSQWVDGSADTDWDYTARTVTQYRTVTTTPYRWNTTLHRYELDTENTVTVQESSKREMTSLEIKAGTPRPADSVTYGQWIDITDSHDCATLTVDQTRTITTTPHIWNETAYAWELDIRNLVYGHEIRTRQMSVEEQQACTPTLPEPEPTPDVPEPVPSEPETPQPSVPATPETPAETDTTSPSVPEETSDSSEPDVVEPAGADSSSTPEQTPDSDTAASSRTLTVRPQSVRPAVVQPSLLAHTGMCMPASLFFSMMCCLALGVIARNVNKNHHV